MTIRIVTDSACDLPTDVAAEHQLTVVPLTIRFGDNEYVDREQLSTAEFWRLSAQSDTLPETAAPAPGQFEKAYRDLAADGASGIVVVTLSSKLSATHQSAELAARSVGDDIDVRVVDSLSVSLGTGTIALAAARSAANGDSIDEVERIARAGVPSTRVLAALDTLDNLKKGGRIGNARALLGTALSIKPIIEVVDGEVQEAGKQRTRAKALRFLADRVATDAAHIDEMAILHADCTDIDDFVARMREHFDGNIIVGEIGPVVGSHAGRGTIGVAYQLNAEEAAE